MGGIVPRTAPMTIHGENININVQQGSAAQVCTWAESQSSLVQSNISKERVDDDVTARERGAPAIRGC